MQSKKHGQIHLKTVYQSVRVRLLNVTDFTNFRYLKGKIDWHDLESF